MTELSLPAELDAWPCVIALPIQWGDQDAFGHVNNTVPIRWFESGRIAYLEQHEVGDRLEQAGLGPILAGITCNYRRQLHYPDQVLVGSRVASIGRSSMAMEHVVYSRSQSAVAADGVSTVVVFDYQKNRPRRVPDEVRAAIEAMEKRSF